MQQPHEARQKQQEVLTRAATDGTLLESDVYDLLDACGLPTPRRVLLDLDELSDLTDLPSFPGEWVYVKLQAVGLLHKTEAGAVQRVGNDLAAVRDAARCMVDRSGLECEMIAGVLVVEQVAADAGPISIDLLLGARRTHDFGPIVLLGPGGITAEFWSEVASDDAGPAIGSALDMNDANADRLLQRMSMSRLWQGYRGTKRLMDDREPARWLQAWADLISYFDGSSLERRPRIIEAEINPLVIRDGSLIPLDGLVRVDSGHVATRDIEAGRRAAVPSMLTLLNPKTVAVAGVSGKRMNPGRVILNNLLAEGWKTGRLAIIKPGTDAAGGEVIDGVSCYPSPAEAPFDVDLYVLAVSAEETITMLESAGRGVSSALLIAGGTSERSDGAGLGQRLGDVLDATGIMAIGPNSLGLVSRPAKVDTLFLPKAKLPRPGHEPAPMAYLSQSGAFMITRMNRLADLEPRYAVSTGNQLRAGVVDVMEALEQDESVRVFAVYVEGFGTNEGRRFATVVKRLSQAGKRVVLYKAGRTERGAGAASGHTASIAGDDRVCRQLLRDTGLLHADSFQEFEELVRLSVGWADRPIVGTRFAAISNAGYECVGIADALSAPLEPVEFSVTTRTRLSQAMAICSIDQLVDIRNPVDLTPMANTASWEAATAAVLDDASVDLVLLSPVPPTPAFQSLPPGAGHSEDLDGPEQLASVLRHAAAATSKPVVFVVDCGRHYDPFADALGRDGAPVFRSADRAVRALAKFTAAAAAAAAAGVP
ncbi:MAG: hypothetical protein D8M59_14225 [Planctomycetes bacterium]|nr:hypothetical protein [Planctomycetota bacterium]NOG55488.1 hypothetical protein [Planctomycetota bacterium]